MTPRMHRLLLAPREALKALFATVQMEHAVYGSFVSEGKFQSAGVVLTDGITFRVDQEGDEGLYHINLHPNGTWDMSVEVKVGSDD